MFKSETLFILGAGSSYPYGYPLGKELIRNIINNIKNDTILIPCIESSKYFYNENDAKILNGKIERPYELQDFIAQLTSLDPTQFSEVGVLNEMPLNSQMRFTRVNPFKYRKITLQQIDAFFELCESLILFDPISIDAFLRDHPRHLQAGKVMIVYSLLKCENIAKFAYDKTGSDNWYSYLLNDIVSGCENPDDIQNNKLNIITFNYDLSLDYCLMRKLTDTEFIRGNEAATTYINKLITSNIYHVYGKLYQESHLDGYGHYTENNKQLQPETRNTRRLIKALQSYESIKSIYQERDKSGKYSELIASAKEIIIIGFGFDRDNLNLLSFPISENDYGDFFDGKTVRYMDFEGKMNGMFSQFTHLQQRFKERFSITRSTANIITNAYLNDFKIFLY